MCRSRQHTLQTTRYPIKPLKHEHYKTVKDIFFEAFGDSGYTGEDLGFAWHSRLDASRGYFSPAGDLLGFGIVRHRSNTRKNYLHFLAVYNHCKGLGYGSKILKAITDQLPNLYMWPEGPNDKATDILRSWYEKQGFRHSSGNFYAMHRYNTRSKQSKVRVVD
jgi:GNAT superfamily N-acetyltransferase